MSLRPVSRDSAQPRRRLLHSSQLNCPMGYPASPQDTLPSPAISPYPSQSLSSRVFPPDSFSSHCISEGQKPHPSGVTWLIPPLPSDGSPCDQWWDRDTMCLMTWAMQGTVLQEVPHLNLMLRTRQTFNNTTTLQSSKLLESWKTENCSQLKATKQSSMRQGPRSNMGQRGEAWKGTRQYENSPHRLQDG